MVSLCYQNDHIQLQSSVLYILISYKRRIMYLQVKFAKFCIENPFCELKSDTASSYDKIKILWSRFNILVQCQYIVLPSGRENNDNHQMEVTAFLRSAI